MKNCLYRDAGSSTRCTMPAAKHLTLERAGKHSDGGSYCAYHAWSMALAYYRLDWTVTEHPATESAA